MKRHDSRPSHRSAFFNAGRLAFLIGVQREANPYREVRARASWDKGFMLTKVNYPYYNYHVEAKLAMWIGLPLPKKEAFIRAQRTNTAQPEKKRATTFVRPAGDIQSRFKKHEQRSGSAFKFATGGR